MSIPRIKVDGDADVLAALFKRAAKNLEGIIGRAVRDERIAEVGYRRRQHSAVMAIAAKLRREYPLPLQRMVRNAWAYGLAVGRIGQPRALHSIKFGGGVNEEALQRIASEMNGTLRDALGTIGRQSDDAFRRAGLLHSGVGIASGSARREISQTIINDLTHQGLTAFVDRRGARWRIDSYANMVAHTTVREAVTQGTAAQILGQDVPPLITVSSHPHKTDVCDPYDGKTFALPGTTVEGYQTIDRLPPFHPWCKHVISAATVVFEDLERTLQRALRAA